MTRQVNLGVALFVVAASLASAPTARAVQTINNLEERVSGEGARGEAQQQNPDVSSAGWAVWWDDRGSVTRQTGNALWAKDLTTRSESRVTVLSTPTSFPRVSGNRVVWEDVSGGNREVLTRQLPPTGPVANVTNNAAGQGFPAIDGTKVVWEDHRDVGTTGIDIYLRDLAGGPEVLVTNQSGDQTDPRISGSTVLWTDRSTPAEPRVMGRVMSPLGAPFVVADPVGTPAGDASVSGTRAVWTEGTAVLTCLLDATGCAAPAVPVWASSDPQGEPDVSGSRVIWLQEDPTTGGGWVWYRDLSVGGANLPSLVDAPTFGAGGTGPSPDRSESPQIDGPKLVWTAHLFRGTDVFWKDVTTTALPVRANSPGLGAFPNQQFVSAGAAYVGYLADSGDFNPRNAVWATELTGDRRTLRVSTYADFGTAISPPKISGNRIAWSDFRDDRPDHTQPSVGANVLLKDLPAGNETRATTGRIGDHPWSSGDRIAWRCAPTTLCVLRSGLITRIDLPVAAGFSLDQQVRVSGTVALWSEFQLDPEGPPLASRLHAVDLLTGEDSVLGSGSSEPSFLPAYDISGSNVVWRGSDGADEVIYRNTVAFPCSPTCDRTASANLLFSPGVFAISTIAMDGTRVAWTQTSPSFQTDVWTKSATAPTGDDPIQVTTGGTALGDVALFGDFVYWSDSRNQNSFCDGTTGNCDSDIYREYIGSGTPPAPLPLDTAAPADVTRLSVVPSSGGNRVSWTNPATPDLAGVVVVRKTVASKAVATSIDDPNGTIVFDGLGTSFLDTDVGAASYTYTAFTYDEVPNYSRGVSK